MKCIALLYSVSDSVLLRSYDEQINIYDSPDEIKHKLERLNAEVLPDDEPEGDDEQQSLSALLDLREIQRYVYWRACVGRTV